MKKIAVLMAGAGLLLLSCKYNKEELLYPQCVTGPVSFSGQIAPLLNSYGCTGCHVGAAPSGGFVLTSYAGVKARVDDGRLYGAITHAAGYQPMPQTGGKLTDCEIATVKAWIDAGAPNN